jgi:hypothetical protein
MEELKQPVNQEAYERHKANSRERTRRYRAKLRAQKLLQQENKQKKKKPEELPQALYDDFPFLQHYTEIKLEEASDQ